MSINSDPGPALRPRLREALKAAMKSRDRVAVAALRSALAAIDNAEAVGTSAPAGLSLAIEQSPVGAGAADIERRVLTDADVREIVRAEVTDREAAASEYDAADRPDRAETLRAEARALATHLTGHSARGGTPESAG